MKKTIFIILICIISLIFFSLKNTTSSVTIEELQQQREELQQQINESIGVIDELEIQITEILEDISKIESQIQEHELAIQELDIKLANIEKSITSINEKLKYIQGVYDTQWAIFEKRVVAISEMNETTYLDVLLSSKSISEFISNYYLIEQIIQYDNDLIENIIKEKETIELIEKTLIEEQARLLELEENKELIAYALENDRRIKNSYMLELTEEEKIVQGKIDLLQKELNLVDSEILYLSYANADGTYVGGELAWPAPGYTQITSPFGMRIHPILKIYRRHSGMDIAIPTGGSVVAANDGIIIKSGYSTSYGNLIMVDHGGGIITLYAHGSERLANVGDQVVRGQIIMKAGSTGWSTGPHLHFAVRINGTCVDPYPYVTTQSIDPYSEEQNAEEDLQEQSEVENNEE